MEDLSKRSIIDMARGAIKERVDYEMTRVVENILDPNTSATAARKITIILLNFEFMESNEETAPEIPTADSYQISVQVNGGEIYQRSE